MSFSCIKYDKIFKDYLNVCINQLMGNKKLPIIRTTNLDNYVYFFTAHIIVKIPESIVPFKIESQEYKNLTAPLEQEFYSETQLEFVKKEFYQDKQVYILKNKEEQLFVLDLKMLDKWFDFEYCTFHGTKPKEPVFILNRDSCVAVIMPIIRRG